MAITLNHTIVVVRDKLATAAFLAEILGLPPHRTIGAACVSMTPTVIVSRSSRAATPVAARMRSARMLCSRSDPRHTVATKKYQHCKGASLARGSPRGVSELRQPVGTQT